MNYPEQIKSIESFNEFIYKEKGSVFIGQVFHIEDEEQVSQNLKDIKKKYFDASHHCYAFKLSNGKIKFSDDGEPKGTAGVRILNAIQHYNLVNLLVIAIRYFGGTKLGVGPLGKAYHNCAINVLQNSKIITRNLHLKVLLKSDFENISRVQRTLVNHNAIIENVNYEDSASISFSIKPAELNSLSKKIAEVTGGRTKLKIVDRIIYK